MKAAATKVVITTEKHPANDELYAKLLLLNEGELTVCIISLDYICMGGGIGHLSDAFFPKLRKNLSALGVSDLICGTTHSHTHGSMIVEEDVLQDRLALAVKELLPTLKEARISSAVTHDASFLINREIPTADGRDWAIRQAHPLPPEHAYDTLAKADDAVRILQIEAENGEEIAVLFTFGCHPLNGYANNAATANFPGIAERLIESGKGGVAMMMQNMGGDVCEVDYKNYFKAKRCDDNGRHLGETVLKALPSASALSSKELAAATVTARFPLRKDFDEKMEAIRARQLALCAELGDCPLNFKSFAPLYFRYLISPDYPLDDKFAYLHEEARGVTQLRDQDKINRANIAKYLSNIEKMEELSRLSAEYATLAWHKARVASMGSEIAVEITGIRIGDITLLSAPFEPLTAIGALLRERYGDTLWPATYSNGYQHYGAASQSYAADAYEVRECDLDPAWLDAYLTAADEVVAKLSKSN